MEPPFGLVCRGLPALTRGGEVVRPEQRYEFHVSRSTMSWDRPDTFVVEIPWVIQESGDHGISYPRSRSQGEWLARLLTKRREARGINPASMTRATLEYFLTLLETRGAVRTAGERTLEDLDADGRSPFMTYDDD
jgi:hypothetical protein